MVKKKVIVEMRVPKVPEHGVAAVVSEIISRFDVSGFKLDKGYKPVPVNPPEELAASLAVSNETVMLVRGEIEEGKEKELESRPNVIKVWTDAKIEPTFDCDTDVSKGDLNSVIKYLGADEIWAKDTRGEGIIIGICDSGVDKNIIQSVKDGWSPWWFLPWGEVLAGSSHGNMCATDALAVCPEAQIYDIGVLKSRGEAERVLSNAIAGFQWAIEMHKKDKTPHILSSSWNMYRESDGADYAKNKNHPFTRKVVEAIREGIIVCFSAGNCGEFCPDGRCGTDTGPERSIWGANGHPDVITVGAVNINEDLAGYSSQGPAALSSEKPDFCGITHFKGYNDPDTGTSAATPIVAGVIGLLKCARPGLKQAQIKAALRKTAKDIGEPGFDHNSGYGIIQAYTAYQLLTKKKEKKN